MIHLLLEALDVANTHGILQAIEVLAVVGCGLWVVKKVQKSVEKHSHAVDHILEIHSSHVVVDKRNPEQKRIIHRAEVLEEIQALQVKMDSLEDLCNPKDCSFHREMLEEKRKIEQNLETFVREGRDSRESTAKRLDEILNNYQKVADALLNFMGKLVERERERQQR
jgi:hypothetical protein